MNYINKNILSIYDLNKKDISNILETAVFFKKTFIQKKQKIRPLEGKTIVNLFFEPSTRTRGSFEIAAKKLGADTINITASSSSAVKGETLLDTARNIEAMDPDLIIIRHRASGAPAVLSKIVKIPIINAGDGFHEHPTQALLDLMTIQEFKGKNFKNLKIAIVGDIAHSRVARSDIYALQKMGIKVIVCGPPTLIPPQIEKLGVRVYYDLAKAIKDVDVIMMLRIQFERQNAMQFPSPREYKRFFSLNAETMKNASPEVIIMHPGPMNRGLEISPDVADGPYSVILEQVANGVAVRMALLYLVVKGEKLENIN